MILNSYLECVSRGEFSLAQKIQFEANELTENTMIENILKKLESVGYSVTERNSCNIVVEIT